MKNLSQTLRRTKFYKSLTPYLATAYAEGFCEGEGAKKDEQLSAWQYLIDTGLCLKLQGWFGRTAQSLIEQGTCLKAKKYQFKKGQKGVGVYTRSLQTLERLKIKSKKPRLRIKSKKHGKNNKQT